ncbi:hypothetical protein QQF64_015182 [Cirrhinus molitorella]|uniref:Ig-like domain-containing protein n=1 Tax=Cirrhinus molitorella TaxID=172907 RepID=A0ABR3NUP8_9TELE
MEKHLLIVITVSGVFPDSIGPKESAPLQCIASGKMTYQACIVFIAVLMHGCFGEDTVNQTNEKTTAIEGQQVTLNCEFKTLQLTPYLYWYIQHSNGFPEYMLMRYKFGSSSSSEYEGRFDAKLDSNSVPLTIKNLRVSDSAVYYCVTNAEEVIFPNNDTVIAEADEKVILSCSYTGTVYDLYWYRQFHGSAPQFLIMESSGIITHATPQVPGIKMFNRKDIKHMELEIYPAAVAYSALYYCAVRPTVKGVIGTPYKNHSDPQ